MQITLEMSAQEKYCLIREELLKIVEGSTNAQSINSKITQKSVKINKKSHQIKDIIKQLTKFLNGYDCTLSERFYYIYHNIHEVVMCKECGNNKPTFHSFTVGYREFCSTQCSNRNKDKQKKFKQTNLERIGVENPAQLPETQEKMKVTNLKRYNSEHASQSEIIKEKTKRISLEKYDVENVMRLEEFKEKNKITRHQTTYKSLSKKEWFKEYEPMFTLEECTILTKTYYKVKHRKCGHIFQCLIDNGKSPRCPKCFPSHISDGEREVGEFLNKYIDNIVLNSHQIISPKELDIYLPDYNLAIEYNGLYWHSELKGKDKNYHIEKSKSCWKKKINLIHIFEDDWNNQSQIVQSMILEKINKSPKRINIDNCQIKKVSDIESEEFLEKHNIHGKIQNSCVILHSYGLFKDNSLVSLLVLGKSRFDKDYEYEIYRFCNYLETSIDNSFNTLFDYAINDLNSNSIIVYTDLRFDTGQMYKDYGFKLIGQVEPIYYYVQVGSSNPKRINQENIENCNVLDYEIIWDCGQAIYKK